MSKSYQGAKTPTNMKVMVLLEAPFETCFVTPDDGVFTVTERASEREAECQIMLDTARKEALPRVGEGCVVSLRDHYYLAGTSNSTNPWSTLSAATPLACPADFEGLEFSVSGQVLKDPPELSKFVSSCRSSAEKILRVDVRRSEPTVTAGLMTGFSNAVERFAQMRN